MPVYWVKAVEQAGGERGFELQSDELLEWGGHFYDHETSGAYVVRRVLGDPAGRYDAIIEADAIIGPTGQSGFTAP